MKTNAIKFLKNVSLVLLISGLSMNIAQAQNRTNKRTVTKVKTVTTKTHKPSAKKVVVTKTIKTTPIKANKRVQATKKNTNRAARTVKLPAKAKFVKHNKVKYAYHNGKFYKPQGKAYVAVNKPAGLRISVVL